MKAKILLTPVLLATAVALGTALGSPGVRASDHDDGSTDIKSQNTNLTDLYVFTEQSQNAGAAANDMIFILNCNPRSVAQQQYYFHTGAQYDVHVSRAGGPAVNDDVITAATAPQPDVTFRFTFGNPAADGSQPMAVTTIRDGVTTSVTQTTASATLKTTPHHFGDPDMAAPYTADNAVNNALTMGTSPMTVFAGLREDPFFFDVEQYFRVRGDAARRLSNPAGPQAVFRNPGVDFTAGYNVLSIVFRVPRSFIQNAETTATTFDVWETIRVRS